MPAVPAGLQPRLQHACPSAQPQECPWGRGRGGPPSELPAPTDSAAKLGAAFELLLLLLHQVCAPPPRPIPSGLPCFPWTECAEGPSSCAGVPLASKVYVCPGIPWKFCRRSVPLLPRGAREAPIPAPLPGIPKSWEKEVAVWLERGLCRI